jgi:hypothetical protein
MDFVEDGEKTSRNRLRLHFDTFKIGSTNIISTSQGILDLRADLCCMMLSSDANFYEVNGLLLAQVAYCHYHRVGTIFSKPNAFEAFESQEYTIWYDLVPSR